MPDQEDVCIFCRLRVEEIVGLDGDPAVCDRFGLVAVPVLEVGCQYIDPNVNANVGMPTAMPCSTALGRSWTVNLRDGFFFMIS